MKKGIDLVFSIDVKCDYCGDNLKCDYEAYSKTLRIEPCESCLQRVKEETEEKAREELDNA